MQRPQEALSQTFDKETIELLLRNFQPLRNIPLPISNNDDYLPKKNIEKIINMFKEKKFRVGRKDNTQIYKFIYPPEADGQPSEKDPIIIDLENTYAITALLDGVVPVVLFITRSGNTFVFQKENLNSFDFEVIRQTKLMDEQ